MILHRAEVPARRARPAESPLERSSRQKPIAPLSSFTPPPPTEILQQTILLQREILCRRSYSNRKVRTCPLHMLSAVCVLLAKRGPFAKRAAHDDRNIKK